MEVTFRISVSSSGVCIDHVYMRRAPGVESELVSTA